MPALSITIIEDEEDISQLLRYNLEKAGYGVSACESGEEGLAAVRACPPDLVLLDLMLPGMGGMDVCRMMKQDAATQDVPVIIISARGEENDIVAGLEQGADDYLPKPFSPKVLLARIRTVLRRVSQPVPGDSEVIRVDDLELNPGKFIASIKGVPVEITAGDFRLLHFLAGHRGWVFTRYQIVDAIRGEGYVVTERAVDVQIAGLRKKLGDYGNYIQTVRGVGYRFKDA
jgi:two-component system phosphate regulon response regulator PhoB